MKCPVEIAHEMAAWQAAEKNGGVKGCGKAAEWKSQKTTFPLRLEIPQNPRDSHFPNSLGDSGRLTKNRTFHLLRKRVISNVVRRGTFLMSVDIQTIISLTGGTFESRISSLRLSGLG
jgi:hypothetical protein